MIAKCSREEHGQHAFSVVRIASCSSPSHESRSKRPPLGAFLADVAKPCPSRATCAFADEACALIECSARIAEEAQQMVSADGEEAGADDDAETSK